MLARMPALRPALAAFALLCTFGCSTGGSVPEEPTPPPHPLMAKSEGVERILELAHPDCAGHFGVDVLRRPRFDEALGEWRDDWLFAIAGGPSCLCVLVDDAWNVRATATWKVTGLSVPWSDVKLYRHRDAEGHTRDFVYYCSRGTPLLEITEVTDFPQVRTVTMQIDPGVPVKVHGAHTLQVHEARGVLVLNGVHVEADPMPSPLTPAAAPALFYDISRDPLYPERVSMYVGPDPGDQTLFDSQFLEIGGMSIWAPTIAQPLRGPQSYFAFYEFADAARMATQPRLSFYAKPSTGTFHNVVQLLPTPDGRTRLAAGFEAWAYAASKPEEIISKCGILDATELPKGEMPKHIAWLVDDHNRRHATHNPGFRMAEHKSHTWDTIPLAHFTGGYYVYACGDDQSSVQRLAHVPVADQQPGEGGGRRNPRMYLEWLKVYNGAWDVVVTPIGDLCSSTDREASFLIEPTHGFVRQFGTHVARDGVVPRIWLRTGVPQVGAPMRVAVSGTKKGDRVRLRATERALRRPAQDAALGAVFCDLDAVVFDGVVEAKGDDTEFAFATPNADQLWFVASIEGPTGTRCAAKTPTATVRVRNPK